MNYKKLEGLIAAVHTPLNDDYSLNLDCVKIQANHLIQCGVSGVFVSGTTGEGLSFTSEERMKLFQTWGNVVKSNHLIFIANIGHQIQNDSFNLALAAKNAGAHAISAMCPPKSKINSILGLIQWLKPIINKTPDIPFYYYDSPKISGLNIDMAEFLNIATNELESLVGLKFNNQNLSMLKNCIKINNGQFDILFAVDEMLISGLNQGCKGAVGSSYNFAASIYHKLIKAYHSGNRNEAHKWQNFSIQFINIIAKYDYLPASKKLMQKFNIDCGPFKTKDLELTKDKLKSLYIELDQIKFFETINGI